MNGFTGMMWWIGGGVLSVKFHAAITYYQEKYGCRPTLCLVNPARYEEYKDKLAELGVEARPDRQVLPGNLFLGRELHADKTGTPEASQAAG